MAIIFKICRACEWDEAVRAGIFRGSSVDLRDGYIHFSTAEQVAETAAKHFAGQDDLLLIAVDAAALGTKLKWEPSRGGALFPHLYADLPVNAALWVRPLPLASSAFTNFRPWESARRTCAKKAQPIRHAPVYHATQTAQEKCNG